MFSTITNYYERLVFERLHALLKEKEGGIDPEYLDDVACVALNRLPPRYVRHSVDLAFHMSDAEWEALLQEVDAVVTESLEFTKRRHDARPVSGEYE
ncbi:late competence development ComFB family protein [Endothiovibrio diazotrophicus]